jgi:hypothetical protein
VNEQTPRTPRRGSWRFWAGLLGAGGILAGVIQGCVKQPAVFPDGVPPICWEQQRARLALGELAVRAMEAYGRIDPGIYQRAAEGGEVLERQGLVPQRPEQVAAFRQALQTVNASEPARLALAIGLAATAVACDERECPPNTYAIQVTAEQLEDDDGTIYRWRVTDAAPPTIKQWRDGFMRLYSYPSFECAPMTPLLRLDSAAKPSAPQESIQRSVAVEEIRGGTMYAVGDGNCVDGAKKCDRCEIDESHTGKWKEVDDDYYCCRRRC